MFDLTTTGFDPLVFSHTAENKAHVFRTIAVTQLCGSDCYCSRDTRRESAHVRFRIRRGSLAVVSGKGVNTMSETTGTATELTSQYSSQVASDLDRNLKEQERLSGEIDVLQGQLAALRHDHSVLVSLQQALGIPSKAATPADQPVATVPAPRKKRAAASGAAEQKTKPSAPAGKRTGKKSTAKAQATHSSLPTLVDLVREHLASQSEPRSAAEITAALERQYPERTVKTTVVRTTLEGLVAKGQAQRAKQGASVFYTAPDTAEPTAHSEQASAASV
ncbi:hypothetical protein [Streptomyces sp. NPDC054783]